MNDSLKEHKIQILSSDIANKIAAGEVVQRPISVVKELVENSIDAGASEIIISLSNSGIDSIKVIDNGIGMGLENIKLALVRHATSKVLSEADIYKIMTLGFRGEALASIASVSKFKLKSSVNGTLGYELVKNGSNSEEIQQIPLNKGTTIEVSNLFYNTPARLKHLSTTFYELSLIITCIHKIALANPNIKFKLLNNDNVIISTLGDGKIKNIFQQIYSTEVAQKLVTVKNQNEDFKIEANIVKPEISRSRKTNMHIAVNGRIIKNYAVENMIIKAYGKLLHTNQYPICYLKIEVDYSLVDINIHPTKEQIKISMIQSLEELVVSTIQNALADLEYISRPTFDENDTHHNMNNSVISNISSENNNKLTKQEEKQIDNFFKDNEIKNINTIGNKPENTDIEKENKSIEKEKSEKNIILDTNVEKKGEEYKEDSSFDNSFFNNNSFNDIEIKEKVNTTYTLHEDNANLENKKNFENNSLGVTITKSEIQQQEKQQENLFEIKTTKSKKELIPNAKFVGIHHKTYLLFENEKGIFFLDQHAAQERIRYELLRGKFINKKFVMNTVLTPVVFKWTASEFLLIKEKLEELKKLGLNFTVFGENTIRLIEVDKWYMKLKNIEKDILNLIEITLQNKQMNYEDVFDKVAIMMACKSSIKAHHYINPNEAINLLEQLNNCQEPYTCPHGRPIILNFTNYELEKMFKRVF